MKANDEFLSTGVTSQTSALARKRKGSESVPASNVLCIGRTHAAILKAVLSLDKNAYGITIQETVAEILGKPLSLSTIYTEMEELEEEGFVTRRKGEPTPQRGGRAKMYFDITGSGREALNQFSEAFAYPQKRELQPSF